MTARITKFYQVGGDSYQFECECGEVARYAGKMFTSVEMQRHQDWHERRK